MRVCVYVSITDDAPHVQASSPEVQGLLSSLNVVSEATQVGREFKFRCHCAL